MLRVARTWASERVQWGQPIGKHEAVARKIARIAADTFAMEAIAELATALYEKGGYDIRLEAAIAKMYNSEAGWRIIDDTLPNRTRQLLGLPPTNAPVATTLTLRQLLDTYHERHLTTGTATAEKQKYQIDVIARTNLPRPDGTTAPVGDWPLADVNADAIERLREARCRCLLAERHRRIPRSQAK